MNTDQVNDEDEDQDEMDEDEDNLDEEDQIIIQQQVDVHGGHHEVIDPSVLMVDEEDEEELIEGDVDDQDDGDEMDGDDHDEDDDLDDDFDDLPSDEDDGGLFLPMGMDTLHAIALEEETIKLMLETFYLTFQKEALVQN